MTRGLVVLLLIIATASPASPSTAEQGSGVESPQPAKKRRPLPDEFGRVVIDNGGSALAGLAPVEFDHWLHRAKFTCRLCHVDVGFGMKAGETRITAADNAKGFFCGACHDGAPGPTGAKVFQSCGKGAVGEARLPCLRCHSLGKNVKAEIDFATFTRGFPRGRFGNGIDWEKAEEQGLIKPVDFLERVSIRRTSMTAQKDFALPVKNAGMPEIIFSHAKHTVWNGCELCHPEIFVGVKKGVTKYSMVEIFSGKYCGACHVSVAFPLLDCQRCHSKPVQ